MLGVTFQAVAKIIVAVLIGAFCVKSIPFTATTMRDFNFLISNVLLPALTVTNTAKAVDVAVLIRCSVMLLLGVVAICIAAVDANVMSYLLFRVKKGASGVPRELEKDVRLDLLYDEYEEPSRRDSNAPPGDKPPKKHRKKKLGRPYAAVILSPRLREMGVDGHDIVAQLEVPSVDVEEFPFLYWGAMVGCSVQNTVALPLPLVQNLAESVAWMSYSEGTAYIFVYSIVASLYMWGAGPLMVEKAQKQTTKRRLIREIITTHKKMLGCADAMTQTDISYLASRPPLASAGPSALPPPPPSTTSGAASTFTVPASASMASAHGALTKYKEETSHEDGSATVAAAAEEEKRGSRVASPLPLESIVPVVSLDKSEPSTTASRATSPPPEMADAEAQTMEVAWTPRTRLQHQLPLLGCAEQIPYDWEAAGRIRVKYADQLKEPGGPSAMEKVVSTAKNLSARLGSNMSFMSVVMGVVIGVIPPLRGLFYDGGPLVMVTDSLELIGQGNVPASLLLLGANLVGGAVDAVLKSVRVRNSEQNTDFPLVPADDRELLGEAGKYAQWYNLNHEQMEFDEHASFSLQTYMQQQSAERIAEARAKLQAEARARAAAEADDEVGATDGGGDSEKRAEAVAAAAALATPYALDDVAEVPPEDEKDEDDGTSATKKTAKEEIIAALSLDGIKKRFLWGIIVERLFIGPLLGFALLMVAIQAVPQLFSRDGVLDKTMLVVLFLELAAPTAINTSLMFNQREYMTYPWAKTLFFEYLFIALTQVLWATVALSYVQTLP